MLCHAQSLGSGVGPIAGTHGIQGPGLLQCGVCQATSLPVSADLQNGFGNDPEDVAVTILQAAKTGIVGGSIDRPLNVLAGMPGMALTVADLQELGVTRISLGGTLARAAYGAMMRAAAEVQIKGTFNFAAEAVSGKELNGIFARALPDQNADPMAG